MSEPKPFQAAAVEAALATLENLSGMRRFLVADEVGLGKTVVASELARRLFDKRKQPMTIYYIANGHSVSYQNKSRIVGFLKGSEFQRAVSTPDRLSLIAQQSPPDAQLLIYALTPLTSFPGDKARLTGGRKEERAFLWVLLEKAYPAFAGRLGAEYLQLNAYSSWEWALQQAQARFAGSSPGLCNRFRQALAQEFGVPVRERLERAVHGDTALPKAAFIGRLRRALVLAAVRHQPPHLIIFDEFQRYRNLLEGTDSGTLMTTLLNPCGGPPPAVLLLSATPYPHLTTRWEETQGVLAQSQMLKLIEFLAGNEVAERARRLFSLFGNCLRDIATQAENPQEALRERIDHARQFRDELRRLLIPIISRTERDCVGSSASSEVTKRLWADPVEEDFKVFRHLKEGFTAALHHEALPYWASVPLPAQSLGPQYQAWRSAKFRPARNLPQMTLERRIKQSGKEVGWPDAKLRAMQGLLPPQKLALPWVAPSLPWWPLGGGWKSEEDNPDNLKLLMFSRFRATPSSVAALISLGVEEHCLPRGKNYDKVYRSRRFKLGSSPGPVMAAFHPSAWLIRHTDPLVKPGASLRVIRQEIRRQILAALPKNILDRTSAKLRRRHRSIALTLAALEKTFNLDVHSARAWRTVIGEDKAAQGAIHKWEQTQALTRLSTLELDDLVEYAIAAPGVILGRALYRHDRTILNAERFAELVQLSWQGLRSYLDNPVFLTSGKQNSALGQVMTAMLDGGFESLLDEHFWLRAQALPKGSSELVQDLRASLGLRAGSFSFHSLSAEGGKIAVRCHVAVPFGNAEAEPALGADGATAQPARPDEVRQSFNTPFWPYVLATTSVGQEGLDFHPWCSRVLHWDLPSNPLDLEQREGRVQRYAGLAVRRRLARLLRDEVIHGTGPLMESPWRKLAQCAGRLTDASGLRPWWVLDHAAIERYIFERPFGRDNMRFDRLKEQRLIYRLALGQPNQEDFIDILAQGGENALGILRPLVLDLSAMGLRHEQAAEPRAHQSARESPLQIL
ncbi:C-terminal helicase domain-containing protein [Pseudomonas asplenii]|uniref:C-terminal helicase domain-containing protein n=1 Tax=Pseudomonas asplenii TaxID=53407 RepID=UPI00035EA1D8|nr:helicase-related protein [Pseudomonas fuscovaginae]